MQKHFLLLFFSFLIFIPCMPHERERGDFDVETVPGSHHVNVASCASAKFTRKQNNNWQRDFPLWSDFERRKALVKFVRREQ